ncbi:MAG: hypothetical protein ABIP55_04410 [Tepidisphaeraceae bacterium]
MDLSKLPKMSQTPPPPAPLPPESDLHAPEPPQPFGHDPTPDSGVAAEVWISAAIGAIMMLMGRTFGAYLVARASGRPFPTGVVWQAGPKTGTEVTYPELEGFTMLTDASIFLFGLVLVLDAAVLLAAGGKRLGLVAFGLAMTLAVTAFNMFVCIKLLLNGVTPILSLLAVAFGVYTAIKQWQLFATMRLMRRYARGS